jgi:flagellar hook-associated protein 3 FlgL
MMSQRVTQQSIANRSLAGLQTNLNRLGKLQEQLSSGRLIARPSDSPAGTASSMRLRSELRATQQHATNADNGLGWLASVDTALMSGTSQLRRARELTLRGMSSGAGDTPQAAAALAAEIAQIRESMINIANTRFGDRPVFGGTTPDAVTGEPVHVQQPPVLRTIAPDVRVRVDTPPDAVFGTGATGVFTVLQSISDALTAVPRDPAALSASLDRLDIAMTTMQTQLSDVGARYNRVEHMRQKAEDNLLTQRTQLSDIEDIDLPHTIMQLKLQEVAYQSALGATARALQPSLMDFLR